MLFQIKAYLLSLFMATNFHAHPPDFQELACMTQAVYYEAGSEPTKGKIAVANVINNRTKHKSFPSTICGVTKQKGQFSFWRQVRKLDLKNPLVEDQLKESFEASLKVMYGQTRDVTNGSLFYVNPRLATDTSWLSGMRKTVIIHNHTFYMYRNPKKQESYRWQNTV